ncbi:MAG: nucleotidyltransferase domain-containing protein [Nitrosopumilaceae archaeon]
MLLHRYLEPVLGNRVTITLLRTMIKYKGKIFTIRGLADEAKVSHNEAALVTHDLEKLGIVKIQPVGRAYQVSLNEQSYILNAAIKPIIEAEKNTIYELVQLLKKHLDTKKIISAAVFGSVVKSEEKLDSDVDILVISNDHHYAIKLVSDASQEAFSKFNVGLSPIIFTEKEFKAKQKGSLIQSIIYSHILICGKKIETP